MMPARAAQVADGLEQRHDRQRAALDRGRVGVAARPAWPAHRRPARRRRCGSCSGSAADGRRGRPSRSTSATSSNSRTVSRAPSGAARRSRGAWRGRRQLGEQPFLPAAESCAGGVPSGAPWSMRQSASRVCVVRVEFSRMSSCTVAKRNTSTSRRTGRTMPRASWRSRASAQRVLDHASGRRSVGRRPRSSVRRRPGRWPCAQRGRRAARRMQARNWRNGSPGLRAAMPAPSPLSASAASSATRKASGSGTSSR